MAFWMLVLLASVPAPIQVDVFVPLCDRALIACGSGAAGDPHSLNGNLYWGAAFGAERFLTRAPGFHVTARSERPRVDRPEILREVRMVRTAGLKEREVQFRLLAYDGTSIDQALLDFFAAPGGASSADLVMWMGHDRLMDVPVPPLIRTNHPRPSIVLACSSWRYFESPLRQLGSTPLAMTQTFMAPEAYLLEAIGEVLARDGRTPSELREALRTALIDAYARYQKISKRAASTVFSRL